MAAVLAAAAAWFATCHVRWDTLVFCAGGASQTLVVTSHWPLAEGDRAVNRAIYDEVSEFRGAAPLEIERRGSTTLARAALIRLGLAKETVTRWRVDEAYVLTLMDAYESEERFRATLDVLGRRWAPGAAVRVAQSATPGPVGRAESRSA